MTVPAHHIIQEPPLFDQPPYPADIFAGRTVIVSGGGSGMGLAMAKAFAQGGAKVAVMGRNLERAQAGAAEIAARGATVHALSADVRDPAAIAAAFDETERVLGPVTLLANNAGANFPVLAAAASGGGLRCGWPKRARMSRSSTSSPNAQKKLPRGCANAGQRRSRSQPM